MSTTTATAPGSGAEIRESWVPMIAICLGQAIMSFNVASLPVALSGMVESFGVPPTTVATGIVMYSLAVAGLVMLGAKLLQRYGATRVFRVVVGLFALGQVVMTLSPSATVMIIAQGLIGTSAAVIVPALVALIANHYKGTQQATAVGALGSARAGAGVAAFTIGGLLGTFVGWRPIFGLLIVMAAIVFFLSFKLKEDKGRPEVQIDYIGVVLAAAAVIFISFGFNNLNRWGIGFAGPNTPFDLAGLSPAPVLIVVGVILLQVFIRRCRQVAAAGRTPLLDLRVVMSPTERAAVLTMFVVVGMEAMLNFTVPLYIQIVQGQTPLATAIAMMPFNLTVFFTAILVVRLYGRLTPRQIGRAGFAICTVALLWLAFVVKNDWSAVPVLFGLIAFGIGQGALVTLVFNVLVTAAPKELAGDVGSLRGTTQNLSVAVGTAVAGALMVGMLSAGIMRGLAETAYIPTEIQERLDLDSINFVSNDQLTAIMERVGATPEQVEEAFRINTEMRLNALKIGLLLMAALAALTILPAGRLPGYKPGEIPVNPPEPSADEERRIARDYEAREFYFLKPRLLMLSLGGTITMMPSADGGIAPTLGAAELVASVPALAEVAEIDAASPFRVASPSLTLTNLLDVAKRLEAAFADGFDAAVVIQGTDTIEESAFLLDLLVQGDKPVVVTGAMRGADAPGADGPANLLSASRVAVASESRGLGTLAVLNYDIHAARFVQKSHTALPSAFLSPLIGPLGTMIEGRPRYYARITRMPCLPTDLGPPRPVALLRAAMGDDTRLMAAVADLGYAGAVIEGMGAGHVHADAAPVLGELAERIPVVLASRAMTGPVFTQTYGYPGAEIDLIGRGLIPCGYLSGLKARLLLGLLLRETSDRRAIADAFAAYQ